MYIESIHHNALYCKMYAIFFEKRCTTFTTRDTNSYRITVLLRVSLSRQTSNPVSGVGKNKKQTTTNDTNH